MPPSVLHRFAQQLLHHACTSLMQIAGTRFVFLLFPDVLNSHLETAAQAMYSNRDKHLRVA